MGAPAVELVRALIAVTQATSERPGFALSAVTMLRIEIWLLVLIPSDLVIGPLGGAGSPAYLLGALLLVWWAITVLDPSFDGPRPCVPLRIVLAGVWVATLASYTKMHMHEVPVTESNTADLFLLELAVFSGIALVAAEGLRTRDDVMAVVRTLVSAVAVMAAIAILQFRPGLDLTVYIARIPGLALNGALSGVQQRGGFNRPSGTAIHPIEFAATIGTVIGFAIHLLAYDHGQSRQRRWICFGLIGLAIPISLSRSGLLVAGCVIVMFFLGAARPLRRPALSVALVSLLIVFMAIPGLIGTLGGFVLAGNDDSSISTRTSDYGAIAHYVRQSPWLGRGAGTFLPSYRILDNQYLLSAIEIGLVGVVGLIALFGLPIVLGRDARRRSDDDAERNLGQMFAAAGLATLLAAATYDALSFPMYVMLVATWTGLSGAWWVIARTEVESASTPIKNTENSPQGMEGISR